MQLTRNYILKTVGLHHSIEGASLSRYLLISVRSALFLHKKNSKNCLFSSLKKKSNIEYRPVIKFFTRKGLNVTEISKELNRVYKDDAPFYRTIDKWLAVFKEPEHGFEDSPRTSRPSTVTTNGNTEAV